MSSSDTVLAALDSELGWIRETYTDLHRHPELSLEEHRTSKTVEGKLAAFGYSVSRLGGTGVVGVLENGDGPTVLARADMDALPVTEATGLPYASTVNGVMHACGHDLHVSALLGAAKLMADGRGAWTGTYIALFQPAEEIGAGSQAMIDDGLVTKVPHPDVALAQHVMPLPAGTVATTEGPVLSAGDSLKITVYGKGAHGSMPHMSVDPVVLAASIVLRLQSIVAREVKPGEFAVVTVGALHAGTTSNIIPDRATLLLNIRTYDNQVRASVLAAIERIVRGECSAAGAPRDPDFEYYNQFPLTSNDAAVTARVRTAFTAHFGPDAVHQAERQTASEDFSRIPEAFGVPYTFWLIGGADAEAYRAAAGGGTLAQDIPANHSPLFAPVMDPSLSVGVQAHVLAALSYLADR
ncbi:amidohydrolase [Arthrobacter sp. SO3]|uniref:amidohydrolase n=1 Tax=Arthrobacter sp. SO3 TaxID=1897057 RepID=UPI001CFFF3AA|nr:amidohydrolase [Arthrobacter sp. SO3]MCB5292036.1 putative hydrolase YxeP [Arthrobacter sp. SO3]